MTQTVIAHIALENGDTLSVVMNDLEAWKLERLGKRSLTHFYFRSGRTISVQGDYSKGLVASAAAMGASPP